MSSLAGHVSSMAACHNRLYVSLERPGMKGPLAGASQHGDPPTWNVHLAFFMLTNAESIYRYCYDVYIHRFLLVNSYFNIDYIAVYLFV